MNIAKHKGPGKANKQGLSLKAIMRLFPDNATAEAWFVEQRWAEGVHCPYCGSFNVKSGTAHKTMPYRCREKDCAKRFSVRMGTVMQASNLGYQTWAIAIYLLATNLKSVSSMKLHRDLEITQKSAWHLAHRLREAFKDGGSLFAGPAEADETHMGGKRKNMPRKKRAALTGRGAIGKAAVAGVRDRETGRVQAAKVEATDAKRLQGFVRARVKPGAALYTDEHGGLSRHRRLPP